jgi:hypothetical protein
MKLIPQKKAFIAWDVNRKNINEITKFYVVEKDPQDKENNFTRDLTFSYGNCTDGWCSLSQLELTIWIMSIFAEYTFKTQQLKQDCLMQYAQIKEAVHFRNMIRMLFYIDLSQKEFEEKYFF